MPTSPLISIVITAFNEERNIRHSLESALAQTVDTSFEVLVVDDGSTDGTAGICRNLMSDDERINLIQLHRNRGHVVAGNTGIGAARGEFVLRLDGDDIIYPELAQSLLDCARQEQSEVVIGGYVKNYTKEQRQDSMPHPRTIRDFIMCGNLISKAAFMRSGGLRPLRFEEYDFFLRLQASASSPFAWNKQALYEYRIHHASYCHQENYWQTGIQELLELWPEETLAANGFSDLLTLAGDKSTAI